MLNVTPLAALKTNYIWMIESQIHPGSVVVVDPGDAQPVIDYLKQRELNLAAILITHHHYDHTDGIDDLLTAYPCPVYAGEHEPVPQTTHLLADQDSFCIEQCDLELQALHVPGHTHGHVAYYGHELLFSGDTLFAGGCGRTFEGTADQLYASLQKLAALPKETQVYCGHEYTEQNLAFGLTVEPDNQDMQQKFTLVTTLRQANQCSLPSNLMDEMNTNIFYRCHLPQVQAAAEKYSHKSLASPSEVFAVLRDWKNHF